MYFPKGAIFKLALPLVFGVPTFNDAFLPTASAIKR